MAKLLRKKGITSQILHVFIQDSSATTGAGLTGLVYNSAGLACRYINAGGTLSGAITLQDITTLGTYEAPTAATNMRFKEVSSASPSQGIYELHIHNDWMNLTGGSLVIMLAGATNMAQTRLEIDLQADVNITHIQGDSQSATDFKDFVDAGYDPGTNKVQGVVLVDTTTTNTDMVAAAPSAATIADAVWDEASTGHVDAGKAGAQLWTSVDAILVDTGTTLDTKLNNIQGATFDTATDSLEAIRNRGDAAWITAVGFSTHSAADVWTVATRALTDKVGFSLTQTFPTNFADMAITASTGLISINLAQSLSALTGVPTTVGGSLYFIRQFAKNKLNYVKATDIMTLYEDDGTTPKLAFTMVDDATNATRSAGV